MAAQHKNRPTVKINIDALLDCEVDKWGELSTLIVKRVEIAMHVWTRTWVLGAPALKR